MPSPTASPKFGADPSLWRRRAPHAEHVEGGCQGPAGDGRRSPRGDSFLRVLEALGYSADLAACTSRQASLSLVSSLVRRARKEAVGGGGFSATSARTSTTDSLAVRGEEHVVGPQRAEWTVEQKNGDAETRAVRMMNCETFVRHNFPMQSVDPLFDHLPLFRGDVRRSLRLASSSSDVPDDLRSPSFERIEIRARMITRDPALQISVSGVVHANLGDAIGMSDAITSDGRFLGRLKFHAFCVHWTACGVHVSE